MNQQDKSLPRQAASFSHLRALSQQYHQLFPIELVIYYHLLNRLLNITIVYQQFAHSIPRHKHHFTQFCGGSEIPRLHHSIREGAWVGIGSDYDTQEVGVDETSRSIPVFSRCMSVLPSTAGSAHLEVPSHKQQEFRYQTYIVDVQSHLHRTD